MVKIRNSTYVLHDTKSVSLYPLHTHTRTRTHARTHTHKYARAHTLPLTARTPVKSPNKATSKRCARQTVCEDCSSANKRSYNYAAQQSDTSPDTRSPIWSLRGLLDPTKQDVAVSGQAFPSKLSYSLLLTTYTALRSFALQWKPFVAFNIAELCPTRSFSYTVKRAPPSPHSRCT